MYQPQERCEGEIFFFLSLTCRSHINKGDVLLILKKGGALSQSDRAHLPYSIQLSFLAISSFLEKEKKFGGEALRLQNVR